MDEISETLGRINKSLENLERRVYALEHPSETKQQFHAQPATSTITAETPTKVPFLQTTGIFSTLGKAMLGIAGAYLLRALAESSVLPQPAVIAIAIAYSVLWLIAATRVPIDASFPRVTYAITSILILLPMLWELMLRFKTLPAAWAAAALAGYAIAASALAWRRRLGTIVWVTHSSACGAALALALATYLLAPFILALFVIAATNEFAEARGFRLGVRTIVAAATDIAVWVLIFVYSGPISSRADYPPHSAVLLQSLGYTLLVIYGASAMAHTIMLRRRITPFHIIQTLIAFVLAAWCMLRFWTGPGAQALGILCLLSAVVGYAIVYSSFRGARERYNYYVYSTGSAALFLAGSYLLLPPFWLVLLLSIASVAASIMAVRTRSLTLAFHGLAYEGAAAFSSGLLAFAFHAMTGTFPFEPRRIVWMVAVCVFCCYALVLRIAAAHWTALLLCAFSAALAVAAGAAVLLWALVCLTTIVTPPQTFHIAVIRTLAGCSIALVLAWAGSRWQRAELAWIAYAVLAFIASKLLFEDLRLHHLGFAAASIFLYAVTLLCVPRLVRSNTHARNMLR